MIYIDPPYNTGGDFVYPDNFVDPLVRTAEKARPTKWQVIIVSQIKNMGSIEKRRPILVARIEAGSEIAGWVLHGTDLIQRLWEGVIGIPLQMMPATVVQRHE